VGKEREEGGLVQKGSFPFLLPFDSRTEKGRGETDRPAGRQGCSPAALATVMAGRWGKMKGATRSTYSVAYLGWGRPVEAALRRRVAAGGGELGRRCSDAQGGEGGGWGGE
jgi:hypothetical protein